LRYYGTITVVWPGFTIWITPAHAHISFEVLFSAGNPAINAVGAPVTQGAGKTGTQGIGVSTPSAAAVAAATVGFDGDEHIPNGSTFTIGLLSMMFAAGGPPAIVLFCGSTTSVLGAAPKLHCSIAPMHT